MAAISPQLAGVKWPRLSSSAAAVPLSNPFSTSRTQLRNPFSASPVVVAAVAISNAQTRERERLKELFREARERCIADPMDGVSFTLDEFHAALDKHGESESEYQVGTKVKGTVFMTDDNGALVDIIAKSSAYLPIQEASIYKVLHVAEAGIYQGLEDEFVVIGENAANDSLILSLRSTQWDLAWERCQQLHSEDAVVTGKVVGQNKGGMVVIVEGLQGFIPFSQISTNSTAEDLINKKLPLKFLEVDKKQSRLVLSNCKAVAIGQAHIRIGSVVTGIVQGLKPYGAFIDIGGIIGLLHVSQISNVRVSDVATVLQPGDRLKVMILSHDLERGRLTLSTKLLEPKPGDMIQNPRLVFDKADEMAQTIMLRIAQAEAMAHVDISMRQTFPFSIKCFWP